MNEDGGNEAPEVPVGKATIGDRIAAFSMLDQMKDATQAQKCMRLSLVGFSASEIAGMLQTTIPTVHQNLYSERKKLKPSEKKPRATAKAPSSGRTRSRKV
jgi:DNA-directed RNA polymerase specialized sigma24 family protein